VSTKSPQDRQTCYNKDMRNTSTKNLHLEHIEDAILTGNTKPLEWLLNLKNSIVTTKIDGAPAIVWGRNPATGKFFVGTKSVFNKKLIKINESHEDIDKNHVGNVANILHKCFDYLPRTDYIIQGDFIGFGGSNTFCPNTITYTFPEIVTQEIIIAPHTGYTAEKDLRDAIAHPFVTTPNYNNDVKWIKPDASLCSDDVEEPVRFAYAIHNLCKFVDEKNATKIKKCINTFIREGKELDDNELAIAADCDINLIRYWKLVKSIKDDILYLSSNDGPDAYIGNDKIDAEGYVASNEYGTFKLVNREVFSNANFKMGICR